VTFAPETEAVDLPVHTWRIVRHQLKWQSFRSIHARCTPLRLSHGPLRVENIRHRLSDVYK
jgi:hypothetical protein